MQCAGCSFRWPDVASWLGGVFMVCESICLLRISISPQVGEIWKYKPLCQGHPTNDAPLSTHSLVDVDPIQTIAQFELNMECGMEAPISGDHRWPLGLGGVFLSCESICLLRILTAPQVGEIWPSSLTKTVKEGQPMLKGI